MIKDFSKKSSFKAVITLIIIFGITFNLLNVTTIKIADWREQETAKSTFYDPQGENTPNWQVNLMHWNNFFTPTIFTSWHDNVMNFTYKLSFEPFKISDFPLPQSSKSEFNHLAVAPEINLELPKINLSEYLVRNFKRVNLEANKYSEKSIKPLPLFIIRDANANIIHSLDQAVFEIKNKLSESFGLFVMTISDLESFSPRIIVNHQLSVCSAQELQLLLQSFRNHLQAHSTRLALKKELGVQESYTIEVQWREK